jgi:hypothetical protein
MSEAILNNVSEDSGNFCGQSARFMIMSVRTKVVERNTGIYNWGKEHPVIYR